MYKTETEMQHSPCIAKEFVSIFYSFKAGIANAISSFKWMKNCISYE